MEIRLQTALLEKIPTFKVSAILYQGIQIDDIPSMLKGRLQLYYETLHYDLQEKTWSDYAGIVAWRSVFKQTGSDPSRYRPSNEALYRRLKKEKVLESAHSAIAVNNLFSLQYDIPLGIYDIDAIDGNVDVRIGKLEDSYIGLNKRENNMKGIIVTSDHSGPFGSPYVDSERTMVTTNTTNALQLVYHNPETSIENCADMSEAIMKMFVQVHGGQVSFEMLHSAHSTGNFSI